MGQFDQFANQGGPAAESEDALAEARRKADEQLRTADYSVHLPEPLGGEQEEDRLLASEGGEAADSDASAAASDGPVAGDGGDGSV